MAIKKIHDYDINGNSFKVGSLKRNRSRERNTPIELYHLDKLKIKLSRSKAGSFIKTPSGESLLIKSPANLSKEFDRKAKALENKVNLMKVMISVNGEEKLRLRCMKHPQED